MRIKHARRKICVFSGKRGGFGAFVPLMRLIEEDTDLALQILLSDMHASREFGNTAREAKQLFPKAHHSLIAMGTGRGDTPVIRVENLSECLRKSVAALKKLAPDIVLVHADRGEHLMVAYAALNLGIPVAHTQGGDVSGNVDDIQRHATTKLAHIHFPETREAAERIKKMGEEEWRIHTVGSVYIDRIMGGMYPKEQDIRARYGLEKEYCIVLLHPDTYEGSAENYRVMKNVLRAVSSLGMRAILVYPCSDPGYGGVIKAIMEAKKNPLFSVYKNIPNFDFLGLLKGACLLIGNSSCALVEAPYLKTPAINIGKRQSGRAREENVIDAKPTLTDIKKKMRFALTDARFRQGLLRCGYHLGKGDAGKKIVAILKGLPIHRKLLEKRITY